MKIRNVVFSGFAAALLTAVCGAADATVTLTSKDYVDRELGAKANIIDLEELRTTVGKKATQDSLDVVTNQVNANTTDIANIKKADFQTAADVKAAISGLATQESVNAKQDKLTAGTNINILGNVISATGLVSNDKLTEVQNLLQAAINEKQQAGNYAQASDLETLKSTVESLKSGGATNADVENLEAAIATINKDFAQKSELTAVEERLQLAINSIEIPSLAGYVQDKDLAAVAKTGSYKDLIDVPTIPSVDDLAKTSYVDEQLATKADSQTVQNLEQNITNNYLTKSLAEQTYVTEQQVANQITSVVGDDTTGLKKQVADNVAAIAENKNAIDKVELDVQAAQQQLATKADAQTVQNLEQNITNNYLTKSLAEQTYVTEQQVANQITSVVGDDTTGLKKQVADNVAAIAENKNAIDKVELDVQAAQQQLATKADASALDTLVTSQQLAELRTALEKQISDKHAAGEYATAAALQTISDSLAELKGDVYTKEEIDQKIADFVSNGEIDLSGYATTAALNELRGLVNGKQDKISDLDAIRSGALKGATAVQITSITTGSQDGSISVAGMEVPVKGLQSAAYTSVDNLVKNPELPVADGDYMLMVSYQDGVHTYSWGSIEKYINDSGDLGGIPEI